MGRGGSFSRPRGGNADLGEIQEAAALCRGRGGPGYPGGSPKSPVPPSAPASLTLSVS